ncbi:uncharacterized protein LOC141614460 [Silene latifolia]|uniref:uncharacterized protein LOC141614460 n=1 Tax=Silene latifolia TaxID=37657 RepID=UPI003D7821C5
MELVKAKVDVVPVWVKLFNIPLKFLGSCLPAIAGLVGKFVQKDQETHDKIRLSYATVMVELSMDQTLPEKVKFLDESGNVVFVPVEYEWKPISCISCNGIGHNATQCRKPVKKPSKPKRQQKQVWRPVKRTVSNDAVVEIMSSSPILTPTNFPPLHSVRSVPIRTTPAKQIMSAQHIHMIVYSRTDNKTFQLTMIYAFNGLEERVALWNTLKEISNVCNDPWLWLGDFNTVMSPVERLGGNTTDAEMEHFQGCVSICGMEDIPSTGALFTWSNKQNPSARVYSRLDRAMGNQD